MRLSSAKPQVTSSLQRKRPDGNENKPIRAVFKSFALERSRNTRF